MPSLLSSLSEVGDSEMDISVMWKTRMEGALTNLHASGGPYVVTVGTFTV